MRRLPLRYLVAAMAAALTLFLALQPIGRLARPASRILAAVHSAAVGRVPALGLAESRLVAAAHAEEVLKFRPVPRDSASRFEVMRVVKRKSSAVTPAVPAPEEAESAEPPEPPAPPDPDSVLAGDGDLAGRSGSIMRIGSDIHVGPDEVVKGDVNTVGGDVLIEGHVEGNVVAMRGEVHLKSTARVDGDVVCIGGALIEEQGAYVGGQRVTAMGGKNIREWKPRHERREREGGGVSAALVWLVILLGIAWCFAQLFGGRTRAAVEVAALQPGLSFGIGSLVVALIVPSIIALCIVVALLCSTIIGIPLALAARLGYFLFLALLGIWGYVVGAAFLGGAASKRFEKPPTLSFGVPPVEPSIVRKAVIGVLILAGSILAGQMVRWIGAGTPLYGLGTLVLVLGIIASAFATLIGMGAWFRAEFATGRFGRWWHGRRGRPTPVPPPPTGPVPPAEPPVESAPPPPDPAAGGGPSPYAPPVDPAPLQ